MSSAQITTGKTPGKKNGKTAADVSKEATGPKTRFSVLKDFQIRNNCFERFIEDIKSI
jgi:hypothetical protein